MISIERAKAIIYQHSARLASQPMASQSTLGLALAESLKAKIPMPSFDNSAMDGYAVALQDLQDCVNHEVQLLEQDYVYAGSTKLVALKPGHCFKIATGAPIPPGADTVVMQEAVKVTAGKISFSRLPKLGENVRYLGEDIPLGESLITENTVITATLIALLTSQGFATVLVFPPPKISIVATGSELVSLGSALQEGQIYDSNSIMMQALLAEDPCEVKNFGIVGDNASSLRHVLTEALQSNIVLVTGGVSVGDHDYVKSVLTELGVEELFWKVAIQPGKPFFFGKRENTLVFGLPGNPASSFVIFEEFVRPALRRVMGLTPEEKPLITAKLENSIIKRSGRRQYLRGQMRWNGIEFLVTALAHQGSHSMRSLADANCLIIVPENSEVLAPKDNVQVRSMARFP